MHTPCRVTIEENAMQRELYRADMLDTAERAHNLKAHMAYMRACKRYKINRDRHAKNT